MRVLPDLGAEIPTVTTPCSSRDWARDLAPRALESKAPRLQFNVTVVRRDVEELAVFVDLGEELGVG